MIDSMEHIRGLYHLLRRKFWMIDTNDFIWKLGADVYEELNERFYGNNNAIVPDDIDTSEVKLFGMNVEVDTQNKKRISILQDITNQIGG